MLLVPPAGLKPTDKVIRDAFALFECEPLGGPSVNGWSRQREFLRCPYRAYLKYERQMVPKMLATSSKPQDIGSFVHVLMAVHYVRLLPAPVSVEGTLQSYPGWRENCPSPEQMIEALRECGAEVEAINEAQRIWDGYLDYWGEDQWAPVAVEMPAGNPETHTSRYDAVVFVMDGIHDGLWIIEHKSAQPNTDFEQWQMDGEVLGEIFSWDLSGLNDYFGAELRGVCINVLVKSKAPAYRRIWLPVNDALVREFVRNRLHWRTMENLYRKNGVWPKSFYGCAARFDRCGYWDHCTTLSDAYLTARED